jgi:hypothetical protein
MCVHKFSAVHGTYGSSSRLQEPAACPYPEPDEFRTLLFHLLFKVLVFLFPITARKYVLAVRISYLFLHFAHILELLPVLGTLATWILDGV